MIALIVVLGLVVAAIVFVMNIDEDPSNWAMPAQAIGTEPEALLEAEQP